MMTESALTETEVDQSQWEPERVPTHPARIRSGDLQHRLSRAIPGRADWLPPGPAEPRAVQTARWLLRPIAFLESCRHRFGDTFSVRFLGSPTPLVMISDPEAIRALYSEPAHGLPPGRILALRPVMGQRSILLLEGPEHLSRRRLMLPMFHGQRMREYEDTVREIAEREIKRVRVSLRDVMPVGG